MQAHRVNSRQPQSKHLNGAFPWASSFSLFRCTGKNSRQQKVRELRLTLLSWQSRAVAYRSLESSCGLFRGRWLYTDVGGDPALPIDTRCVDGRKTGPSQIAKLKHNKSRQWRSGSSNRRIKYSGKLSKCEWAGNRFMSCQKKKQENKSPKAGFCAGLGDPKSFEAKRQLCS